MLGILGTVTGVIISLAAVFYMNATTISFSFGRQQNLVLAPTISATEIISISVVVIAMAVLASLQPAWKASRMDPIQALRHV